MTEQADTITVSYEELLEMSESELSKLADLMERSQVCGTAVVRKADGTIRYDDEEMEGNYGERPRDT